MKVELKIYIILYYMFAYVIIHFGDKIKYFEYEIFSLISLRKITSYDIVYMYNINDTPKEFISIISDLGFITYPYDDTPIISLSKKFISSYQHFNTIHTCAFIYANQLTKYEKICILESDMIFMKNLDNIFNLNCPAISYFTDENDMMTNFQITNNKEQILNDCHEKSHANGGVMLFKPKIQLIEKYHNALDDIIKRNCKYPNETLFLYVNKKIFNIPLNYNYSIYFLNKQFNESDIYIYHFNNTKYKPIDIIKDKYIKNINNQKKKKIIEYFKRKIYDKYYKNILKIISKISVNSTVL